MKPQPPMKTYRGKLVLDQQAMQVEGSYKRSDEHPVYCVFFKQTLKGKQVWITKEMLARFFEQQREHNKKPQRRDRQNECRRACYANDPTRFREQNKKWKENNPIEYKKSRKRAYLKNPELWKAHASKRRSKLKNNIKLHKDAQDALQGIYALCETLTLCAQAGGSSEAFHVDHVWPILPKKVLFRGKRIRPYVGLHAPWNVQILEASENLSKSNKTPTT